MSNRAELISKMMEMQKQFIEYSKSKDGEFEMAEYYTDDESHPLYNFREKYNELAMQVVDAAHADRGSER
ncbi:MAG: hypothetical protein ACWA5X_01635 [bacterium]